MWHPNVTVAAVIEHNDKFIMVHDKTKHGIKINQPAGHLDPNENLVEAVIREVKEETGLDFIPEKLVGIYTMPANKNITYIRFCFKGILKDYNQEPKPSDNDLDVVEARWYTYEEIMQAKNHHRSQVVEQCLIDYLNGHEHSLDIIRLF
ncbi:MAG: NUDIX domain-containing protein [Burkholderiales bacterium]|nr:NUDIX domain-containing protein [Burkholderiales bacterium]